MLKNDNTVWATEQNDTTAAMSTESAFDSCGNSGDGVNPLENITSAELSREFAEGAERFWNKTEERKKVQLRNNKRISFGKGLSNAEFFGKSQKPEYVNGVRIDATDSIDPDGYKRQNEDPDAINYDHELLPIDRECGFEEETNFGAPTEDELNIINIIDQLERQEVADLQA